MSRVHYPGLATHPQHELAKRQMSGPGGMISSSSRCDLAGSRRFLQALRIFALAESLGGVESLAEHPALMTHASIPAENRKALGISDSLVRLSVGIEHVDDLWRDLRDRARTPCRLNAGAQRCKAHRCPRAKLRCGHCGAGRKAVSV